MGNEVLVGYLKIIYAIINDKTNILTNKIIIIIFASLDLNLNLYIKYIATDQPIKIRSKHVYKLNYHQHNFYHWCYF